MADEPRVRTAWVDSPFADLELIATEAADGTVFSPFVPLAFFAGRLTTGADIIAVQPLDVISTLDGRPVFLVHGSGDQTIPVSHATLLTGALEAEGSLYQRHIFDDSQHVDAMFDYPEAYESDLTAFFTDVLNHS